jgi:hypothetical protein
MAGEQSAKDRPAPRLPARIEKARPIAPSGLGNRPDRPSKSVLLGEMTTGKISAKRLLPIACVAGYEGSARDFRRLVAEQKMLWRKANGYQRRPAVWSPGEYLVMDWAEAPQLGKSSPLLSRVVLACANGEFSQEFSDRFGGLIDVHEVTNALTVRRLQRACDAAR